MTAAIIGVFILAALVLAPLPGMPQMAASDERQITMVKDWDGQCDSITRVEGLDGETGAQMAKLLGEPESKETFRLGDRPDEFHVTLQNHYPLDKAANSDVQVQEWTWARNKCRLTVWLHKKGGDWVGLENIRYPADAEF